MHYWHSQKTDNRLTITTCLCPTRKKTREKDAARVTIWWPFIFYVFKYLSNAFYKVPYRYSCSNYSVHYNTIKPQEMPREWMIWRWKLVFLGINCKKKIDGIGRLEDEEECQMIGVPLINSHAVKHLVTATFSPASLHSSTQSLPILSETQFWSVFNEYKR